MKKALMAGVVCLLGGILISSLVSCNGSAQKSYVEKDYYTKYNFHYTLEKGRTLGSIANWTKVRDHQILPYNSKVHVKKGGTGFYLTDLGSGRVIDVMSNSKFLAGMSTEEYWDKILSDSPVSYPNLSSADKQGIANGRPAKGMTKEGVMIAMGYPCPHKTPSPQSNTWEYWENRFGYYFVTFENGVVVSSGY